MAGTDDFSRVYASARPNSGDLFARARRVLAGGVGHDLRHFLPVPLYIERGEGGRKWDVDGHEYIDFLMGNGALLLGHADPGILTAIEAALGQGTHFGNDHPLQIEWAEWVQRLVPSAERVRFVNSGTEASHLAIRLARAFTRRSKVLRFDGHFHGWHDGVVHGFHPPFDADGSRGVPSNVWDHFVAIPDSDMNLVEDVLGREPDIAAVIIEPSGASWGRVPLADGFLRDLRELTQRKGVPLIFDEVITGFRFSPGGAQELYGVLPDLSCFAKILAGGMPGGAVVGRSDITAGFDITGDSEHDRHERVVHLGTFNAAPLSAAAGVALLKRVATGEPIRKADAMAEKLRTAWESVLERHGIAGYVYGPSSTFHVYFETDRERIRECNGRANLFTTDAGRLKSMPPPMIAEYQRRMRHYGVDNLSFTGGLLSAAHTDGDISEATDAFERTVVELHDMGLIQSI